jgi:hypothetical protein
MHYNKQILQSDNEVKAVWKIVKKEYSTVVTPSVKIYNNVKKKNKIIADSFNTYF